MYPEQEAKYKKICITYNAAGNKKSGVLIKLHF